MHRPLAGFFAAVITVAAMSADVRSDTVFAVSFNDGRIIRYESSDPAGTVTTLSGTGVLTQAAGLALGPDGKLYIGEAGDFSTVAPSIRRLDLATNTLSTLITFSEYDIFPGSLAFKGSDLLVGRNPLLGDTGSVLKLANATGNSPSVSSYTSGGSLASSPGLAFGPDGVLYVSNQTYDFQTSIASGPVVKFDASGAYVGETVAGGSANGLFGPTGIAIRGSTLFTSSIMAGTVLQTNLLTGSTSPFGSTGVPFGASPLAVLSDGGLVVGSAGGPGAIYRFDAAGNLSGTFNSGLGTIGGLVVVTVPEPATVATAAIGVALTVLVCRTRRVMPS